MAIIRIKAEPCKDEKRKYCQLRIQERLFERDDSWGGPLTTFDLWFWCHSLVTGTQPMPGATQGSLSQPPPPRLLCGSFKKQPHCWTGAGLELSFPMAPALSPGQCSASLGVWSEQRGWSSEQTCSGRTVEALRGHCRSGVWPAVRILPGCYQWHGRILAFVVLWPSLELRPHVSTRECQGPPELASAAGLNCIQ